MRSVWKQEISPHEPLWRYFKTERFLALLDSSALHFASARQFDDRFEGAVAVQSADLPIDPRYAEPEPLESAYEELRRLTKLSCWHRADYESDAMWKLYASLSKGVAIRTTVERLGTAVRPFRLAPEYSEEEPTWGKVRYVNLLRERLNASMLERFFYKHQAFAWEREFRVAISLRTAEEFGVPVPVDGIHVPIDSRCLVESIYLGPALVDSDHSRIRAAVERVGLSSRLVVSSLLGRPRYI